MGNKAIKANREVKDLKNETGIYSKLLRAIRERISLHFIIFGAIYLVIEGAQASGILLVSIRHLAGIIEIGLSIFLCYNYGYLGMALCVPTNAIASVKMMIIEKQISNDIAIVVANASLDVTVLTDKLEDLLYITEQTAGLLFCLSATRIAVIVASIIVAYISEQGRKNIKRLEWLANIDGVTGLFNYRYFQTKLKEEIAKANETNTTLGMLMIDLDNFKKYNDNYGHKAGDMLLSKSSHLFLNQTREQDIVCRYGGDEFAILLPEANSERILSVIEQIRKAFDKMADLEELFDLPDKVTLSAGYSIYPDLSKTKDELIMQADSALYQAKNMGRNNVQLYRDVFEDIKVF